MERKIAEALSKISDQIDLAKRFLDENRMVLC